MSENILIFDEVEARAQTEATMRATALRYGVGGRTDGPTTQMGSARAEYIPAPNAQPLVLPASAYPIQPPDFGAPPLPQPADHLLLTPAARPGATRLVRMHGTTKSASWLLEGGAADVCAEILRAFGIAVTDLREDQEDAQLDQ